MGNTLVSARLLRNSVCWILGISVLWVIIWAVDSLKLKERNAFASIRAKMHREIEDPVSTEAAYILEMEINGERLNGSVNAKLYEILEPGDRIEVVYLRRRLSGSLEYISVPYEEGAEFFKH